MGRDRYAQRPATRLAEPVEPEVYNETLRRRLSVYGVDGWYQDNVTANQTDVLLTRLVGAAPDAWIAPRAGRIVSVWVYSSEARSAGTLTIEVFKNGTQFGTVSVSLNATYTTFDVRYVKRQTLPFAAGDRLDLRITTDGSWAPTTADVRAGLEVET